MGAWIALGLVTALPMCDADDSNDGSGAEAGEAGRPHELIPGQGGADSSPGGSAGELPIHNGGMAGDPHGGTGQVPGSGGYGGWTRDRACDGAGAGGLACYTAAKLCGVGDASRSQ